MSATHHQNQDQMHRLNKDGCMPKRDTIPKIKIVKPEMAQLKERTGILIIKKEKETILMKST
jgi:hypothetical protein